MLVGLNMMGGVCVHCICAYSPNMVGRTTFCPVLKPDRKPSTSVLREVELIAVGFGPSQQHMKCFI